MMRAKTAPSAVLLLTLAFVAPAEAAWLPMRAAKDKLQRIETRDINGKLSHETYVADGARMLYPKRTSCRRRSSTRIDCRYYVGGQPTGGPIAAYGTCGRRVVFRKKRGRVASARTLLGCVEHDRQREGKGWSIADGPAPRVP